VTLSILYILRRMMRHLEPGPGCDSITTYRLLNLEAPMIRPVNVVDGCQYTRSERNHQENSSFDFGNLGKFLRCQSCRRSGAFNKSIKTGAYAAGVPPLAQPFGTTELIPALSGVHCSSTSTFVCHKSIFKHCCYCNMCVHNS
jgi:hypothetical protein